MKLADIYAHFQEDIFTIERELEEAVQARHNILRKASVHLLKAGGKRIRPVFVLLAGKFGTYDVNVLKHIAVALELIHMASLVHDDVIDDADLRRGKKTIKSQWDNRIAMYTGDYMFAKAVQTATYFDDPNIHQIISNAINEMCLGEVEQIRDQYNPNQHLRIYFRRIKRKTALLIAVSCQLGALAAKADPAIVKKLYYFGYYVGMSFQITDDVLDFVGTEEQLGKPAGSDLLQGNVTLPALYALHHDMHAKRLIEQVLADRGNNSVHMEEVIAAIVSSGGIDYALSISDLYLKKAMRMLDHLPDDEPKQFLQEIANYIGRRKF
ncbi:heptaprenyl diphosphate synthase component II [Halalkalibacterium halodurans]|uniref:heptaprenyl diphosphate synthase component II n=1 Tax=Halalkalibacterium halodurans TaxID=86665 RepID=UPI002E1C949F|nr:heptaprenyl diphosphate synthase component II [Halalkalibacterium halodurans]MED4163014.1 heptaprenyl diphosphate synthase component II [Halalkalibacterium halodurans]